MWHRTVLTLIFLSGLAYADTYSLRYTGQIDNRAGINSLGQTAGNSLTGHTFALVWTDGTLTPLGPGTAYGINDDGEVVGQEGSPAGPGRATVWKNGSSTDLGTFADGNAGGGIALGVNSSGVVVGGATAHGVGVNSGIQHAFVYYPGVGKVDIGTLGGNSSQAFAINNAGDVVGFASPPSGVGIAAFLWHDGIMTSLVSLPISPSQQSIAYGINDFGLIVGQVFDGQSIAAAVWENGVETLLPKLPGLSDCLADSVNNAGVITGYCFSNGVYRPFLYENDQLFDLNTFIPSGTGWTLEVANGINNAGQITGYGDFDGNQAGFVLTQCSDDCTIDQPPLPPPSSVPEPSSILLFSSGLLILLRRMQSPTSRS